MSSELLENNFLEELFEAMILGDGNVQKNGSKVYYTSSKELANSFQDLCVRIGLESRLIVRNPRCPLIRGRKINGGINYEIFIRSSKNKKIIPKKHISDEHYNGMVYCVSVPEHTLYVRRNGTTTWCGNSGTTAVAAKRLDRQFLGFELCEEYVSMGHSRVDRQTISSKIGDVYISCFNGQIVTARHKDIQEGKDYKESWKALWEEWPDTAEKRIGLNKNKMKLKQEYQLKIDELCEKLREN